ncbi:MAG: DUF456 domain-containing protein [Deltaproteobacteria bacterium]|nr:DUF456 domain-containing protein [Deltaproteobacteria bacterium]
MLATAQGITLIVVALLLMLVGLLGTIVPWVPGVPLIYGVYLVYGLVTGWESYGLAVMAVLGGVTAAVMILDFYAGALGAKRFGATPAGAWGSIIGAILGLVLFNVIGLIVGTFAGAMSGELLSRRPLNEAVRSGWGALVGFLAGTLFRFVTATVMIGLFVWLVFQ